MVFTKAISKISLAILLVCSSMEAQSFKWSEGVSPIENELGYKIEHQFDKRLFKIKSKYNDAIFDEEILVDIFDPKDDFDKDETVILTEEQPVMGLSLMQFVDKFPLKEKDYVFFGSNFNKETRDYELFARTANIDTGTKTKWKFTSKMPAKNRTNPGNYYVAQSPNKSFYVVLKEPSYDKKVNKKITLALLDASFKTVKEIEYEFPFSSKQSGNHMLYVSDTGNVFMVKEIDLPKIKPYKSLYFWNSSTNAITEQSLSLEKDYQLHQFRGQFIGEDFYLQGIYSDNAKSIKIRYSSIPEGANALGIIAARFSGNGEKKYITLNPIEKLQNLNIKDFVIENGKTWALFDKLAMSTKRLPSADPAKPLEYRYEYNYFSNGMAIGMIDNQTGNLEWMNNLINEEPETINDNGVYLSYLYRIKDNKLSIIYNDTRDMNKGAIRIVHNSRFPVLETYDATGKLLENRDLLDAGVGASKKNCFELDTSIQVPAGENNFVVRARCGNEAKYGFLTF